MLLELSIRNFAIIEDISIRLKPGLTILSGETGAGKSIIINAVNLLLGGRASTTLIRTGADGAELEALFDVPAKSPLANTMADVGYDPGEGLMVRRLISRSDRHRVYVNGRLATMQTLGELTAHLASISGQHANQSLLREEEHLTILDQFGGLMNLRRKYHLAYNQILPVINREQELLNQRSHQDEQLALLKFQRQEIEQAAISIDEDTTLEKERRRLKSSESLLRIVRGCVEQLYSKNNAVVETLFQMSKEMTRAGDMDEQLMVVAASLENLAYDAEDLVNGLNTYLKDIDLDSQRLETVEARIDLLNKLKRKFGGSLEKVLEYGEEINQRLAEIENIDDTLTEIKADLENRHRELCRLAGELTAGRGRAARKLSAAVEQQLADLKMAGTQFSVTLTDLAAGKDTPPYLVDGKRLLSPTGGNGAAFLIAPNVGETAKPLAAIASGGELSRVVLALKAIEAESDALETIIFDEVDAGIGGATADQVGRKLALLARSHQVVCITHLPQIACYGDHHFRIEKQVRKARTHTTITQLNPDQRVVEIARLLGGENITPTTMANAKEMLGQAREEPKSAVANMT